MRQFKKYLVAGLLAACSQAWAAPTLSLVTSPNPVTFGSVLDLDVRISDAVDLYNYNFSVNFDASLFRAISVAEGAFLGSAGDTFAGFDSIDNTTGKVSYVYNVLVGPETGAFGSGSLAHIRFEAIGVGSAAFSLSDLAFGDSTGADIAVAIDAGAQVAVIPEPASYALFGIGLLGAAALRRRSQAPRA